MSPLPSTDNVVALRPLVAAVQARLTAQVPTAVGWVVKPDDAVPVKPGTDGIVAPHWILYSSPGTPTGEDDLGDTAVDLAWLFQVTAVAGHPDDLEALLTRIHSALYRWEPVVDGLICGPCRPPLGYDPGPIRRDTTIAPARLYVPLQYATTVTR